MKQRNREEEEEEAEKMAKGDVAETGDVEMWNREEEEEAEEVAKGDVAKTGDMEVSNCDFFFCSDCLICSRTGPALAETKRILSSDYFLR